MKHYDIYKQVDPKEIENLVQSAAMTQLITLRQEDVQIGMFNPVYREGCFFLHLNKTDSQFQAIQRGASCRLVFFDFLCHIPSYWVHAENGGAATSYYRYAEFTCDTKIYVDADEVAEVCQNLLDKYQPEGGYAPLNLDSPLYKESLQILGIVCLKPVATLSKWKLGQNRPIKTRLQIMEELKQRNQGNDSRAREEIQKWIHSQQNPL